MVDSVAVAIYNTDLKKLVAITATGSDCAKWLFGRNANYDNIRRRLVDGKLIDKEKTLHDFTIKIKIANTEQKKLLGKEKIFIND